MKSTIPWMEVMTVSVAMYEAVSNWEAKSGLSSMLQMMTSGSQYQTSYSCFCHEGASSGMSPGILLTAKHCHRALPSCMASMVAYRLQHESYGAVASSPYFFVERAQYLRSSLMCEFDICTLWNKRSAKRKWAASLKGPQSFGGKLRGGGGVPWGKSRLSMSVGCPVC